MDAWSHVETFKGGLIGLSQDSANLLSRTLLFIASNLSDFEDTGRRRIGNLSAWHGPKCCPRYHHGASSLQEIS